MSSQSLQQKAETLRSLVRLISTASEDVISSWETDAPADSPNSVPSPGLYEARRILLGAAGMLVDTVQDPQARLMEIGTQFYESRALHVAVDANIPDLLAKADPQQGVPLADLAQITGINPRKLGSVLRCLCAAHIFQEVAPHCYTNNSTSQVLVNNVELQSWIKHFAMIPYFSSGKLPQILFDPKKTDSEDHCDTAFQVAFDTDASMWDWLQQQPDGKTVRPDLEIFNLAMVGGGKALGPPLYVDFPWESLGSATIVDVGGGMGGMSLGLAKLYPELKFIVQDHGDVIEQAKSVWKEQMPSAIDDGRVKLMPHDFFKVQPVQGADVYNLRYILHDWSDDNCVKILRAVRPALSASSRLLICDQVLNTTYGSPSVPKAPHPLPANYGYAARFSHLRDLNMLTHFNGRERTVEELEAIVKLAGLRVEKLWPCRGLIWITEVRLAED